MIRVLAIFLGMVLIASLDYTTRNSQACPLAGQTGCSPCIRPDPDPNKKVPNRPADVTDVAVDRNEVKLPPPKPGDPPTHPEPSGDMTINVVTTASDPEGDTLTYNYTVSGGRIVGQGSNVTWDLNGVLPGTYTITAGVDDGCGLCGKTVTQTVKVEASEGAPACICSEIRIEALHYKLGQPAGSSLRAFPARSPRG